MDGSRSSWPFSRSRGGVLVRRGRSGLAAFHRSCTGPEWLKVRRIGDLVVVVGNPCNELRRLELDPRGGVVGSARTS